MSNEKVDPSTVHADRQSEAFDEAARDAESMPPPTTPPSQANADATDPLPPFKPLGELGPWLTEEPPPRRWLLKTRPKGSEPPEGVLPLAVVGMLAAQGAAGKTWALTQLALSVSTGHAWLDNYAVDEPGNVLLALGEEPEDEVRWRLYYAAQEMGLTEEEKRIAAVRLFPLALSGRQVALTLASDVAEKAGLTELPETPVAQALRKRLEGREWRLIEVDPLSRFAGPDVELDAAQATRFIQVLETFTRVAGNPTVIFAHHTGKAARKDSQRGADATAARGSSALSDAVRWQANLVPERKLFDDLYPASKPRLLTVSFPKTTRSPYTADLRLVRGRHGVLRPADEMEAREYDNAAAEDTERRRKKPKKTSSPEDGAAKARRKAWEKASKLEADAKVAKQRAAEAKARASEARGPDAVRLTKEAEQLQKKATKLTNDAVAARLLAGGPESPGSSVEASGTDRLFE